MEVQPTVLSVSYCYSSCSGEDTVGSGWAVTQERKRKTELKYENNKSTKHHSNVTLILPIRISCY